MKNNNNSFLIRRGFAYLVDLFFITFVSMLIMQITFINPNYEKYEVEYTKYQELIDNTEDVSALIESEEYNNIVYNISKYSVIYTFVNVALYIGYFVIFQRSTQGQTLGKKLFKIKVISNNSNNVKLWQLFLRTLFIYNIVSDLISGVSILLLPQNVYINFNSVVVIIFEFIMYASIIMLVFRADGRGLHDLVGKTKVVDLKIPLENNVVEAQFEEKNESKKDKKKEDKR